MKIFRWIALSLLLLAPLAQAQVYRWVDANGKTVFSDRPPPGAKAERLTLRGGSAPATSGGPANVTASGPAASGKLEQDVKAINDRINAHNGKVKQDNCRMAKDQLLSLQNTAKSLKKPDTNLDKAMVAAKDNIRIWCVE